MFSYALGEARGVERGYPPGNVPREPGLSPSRGPVTPLSRPLGMDVSKCVFKLLQPRRTEELNHAMGPSPCQKRAFLQKLQGSPRATLAAARGPRPRGRTAEESRAQRRTMTGPVIAAEAESCAAAGDPPGRRARRGRAEGAHRQRSRERGGLRATPAGARERSRRPFREGAGNTRRFLF